MRSEKVLFDNEIKSRSVIGITIIIVLKTPKEENKKYRRIFVRILNSYYFPLFCLPPPLGVSPL